MEKVLDRVAKAVNESPISKDDIGKKLDLSYHTIHRWSKGEKENFKESELKSLAKVLDSELPIGGTADRMGFELLGVCHIGMGSYFLSTLVIDSPCR